MSARQRHPRTRENRVLRLFDHLERDPRPDPVIDAFRPQMRVGLAHAVSNTAALGLYTASLACRVTGRTRAGRTLGFLGLAAVGAVGRLGGHLAYRQAAGAHHAEAVPDVLTEGRHRIGAVDDFPPGRPVRRSADNVPVVVVREAGGQIHALADRCSHLAGPLSEGTVSDGCVRRPWHGSVFRLSDGLNVRGPAIAPQPAFDTRVADGQVEVRLRRQEGKDTTDGETDRYPSEAGHEHIH
jgi:nitrite reductase/ring-hydroxylating ferredoxin subunit